VPENKATRSSIGYEARIAMLIGFCALCVGGYTAYMQRQQVRAQVWPILQFDSNNGPIEFTLANKGVGPAIIKHIIVRVDGQPVRNWLEVLNKFGAEPHYQESDMNNVVLSAGEKMTVLTPHADDQPIAFDRSNPIWVKLNEARLHVSVEICYCSTLGECWTLRAGGNEGSTTTACRGCPTRSAISFQQ
jgi:hypothetical protein